MLFATVYVTKIWKCPTVQSQRWIVKIELPVKSCDQGWLETTHQDYNELVNECNLLKKSYPMK